MAPCTETSEEGRHLREWKTALKAGGSTLGRFLSFHPRAQLISEAREQEARWPHFRDDLSSLVLHIPADQVARLKALAATPVARSDGAPAAAACSDGGPAPTHSDGAPARSDGNSATAATISTNDAVAGLVWTLMCQLRGRPLPGQRAPPGGSSSGGNSLGLAVDLRRNGLQGVLPLDLFANAT